jgi:hypothetical protein
MVTLLHRGELLVGFAGVAIVPVTTDTLPQLLDQQRAVLL